MNPEQNPDCLRCGIPMERVRAEDWMRSHVLLKQLQKIADSIGLRMYHCKQCGKVEFYR